MVRRTSEMPPGSFCLLLRDGEVTAEHIVLYLRAAYSAQLARLSAALEEAPDTDEVFLRARLVHDRLVREEKVRVLELVQLVRDAGPRMRVVDVAADRKERGYDEEEMGMPPGARDRPVPSHAR